MNLSAKLAVRLGLGSREYEFNPKMKRRKRNEN